MRIKQSGGGGVPVIPGPPGKDAYELALTRGVFSGTFDEWLKSLHGRDGSNGLSAYELARANGFDGTQDEWEQSLRGKQGEQGMRGPQGATGPMGPMPQHEWRGTELRFQMTPDRWGDFVDLQGPKGDPGKSGGGGGVVVVATNSWEPAGW